MNGLVINKEKQMRLITRQIKANDVVKSWSLQYPSSHKCWENKQATLKVLIGLGANPNPDAVDRIIGNGSWTRTECHECNDTNVDVVEIGQRLDHESSTANVCKKCLNKAIDHIK